MEVNERPIRRNIAAEMVLPGGTLELRSSQRLTVEAGEGQLEARPGGWRWQAPRAPGHYPLTVRGQDGTVILNVLVLRPSSEMRDGRLGEYQIGHYPRRNGRSTTPAGFIEVWRETESVALSPHFRIGQFLCKQAGGYPKYLVVDLELIDKLEGVLQEINAAGHNVDTLEIMSGFRTPAYNAGLNNVSFSQHLFGRAADVYVDTKPPAQRMDDLDRDGRADIRDVHWLFQLTSGLEHSGEVVAGGLGGYRANAMRGPFLHVDARGTPARWGELPAGLRVSALR